MKISEDKKNKISEQILALLFDHSPEALFTSQIALQLARDEEFTKILLNDLEKKGLIIKISKNPKGLDYSRRQRLRLSADFHNFYKTHPSNNTTNNINPTEELD